jgi:nitronate monooxygenase
MTPQDFMTRLGLDLPVIQAPMAGVSNPVMAAEVANAGALGSLGLGASDVEAARKALRDTQARTNRAVNANFFCHAPATPNPALEAAWLDRLNPIFAQYGAAPPDTLREIYTSYVADPAMQQMVLDAPPKVVSFHFGLPPRDHIAALQAKGVFTLASATNLAEARLIEAAGIDAIVAQGWEAGGHRGCFDPDAPDGRLGTMALVRVLAQTLHTPVIAAGGIMDAAGVRAALDLGAVAAQMGTAFVTCAESSADAGYRAAMASDSAHATTMTRTLSGRPARCLANRFTEFGAPIPNADIPAYPIAYDAAKALNAAAKSAGESGYGAQWAGQGAPLAQHNLPSAQIVAQLRADLGY